VTPEGVTERIALKLDTFVTSWDTKYFNFQLAIIPEELESICIFIPKGKGGILFYRKWESDGSKNASHDMGYLYEACDQLSDFCHQ
jgi:hypothetical protein